MGIHAHSREGREGCGDIILKACENGEEFEGELVRCFGGCFEMLCAVQEDRGVDIFQEIHNGVHGQSRGEDECCVSQSSQGKDCDNVV